MIVLLIKIDDPILLQCNPPPAALPKGHPALIIKSACHASEANGRIRGQFFRDYYRFSSHNNSLSANNIYIEPQNNVPIQALTISRLPTAETEFWSGKNVTQSPDPGRSSVGSVLEFTPAADPGIDQRRVPEVNIGHGQNAKLAASDVDC